MYTCVRGDDRWPTWTTRERLAVTQSAAPCQAMVVPILQWLPTCNQRSGLSLILSTTVNNAQLIWFYYRQTG